MPFCSWCNSAVAWFDADEVAQFSAPLPGGLVVVQAGYVGLVLPRIVTPSMPGRRSHKGRFGVGQSNLVELVEVVRVIHIGQGLVGWWCDLSVSVGRAGQRLVIVIKPWLCRRCGRCR